MQAGGGRCTATDSHSRQTASQRERERGVVLREREGRSSERERGGPQQDGTGLGLRRQSISESIVTIVEVHVG